MGAAADAHPQMPPLPLPPLCYVIAGVSGSGKSCAVIVLQDGWTTGKILADRLACPFFDGDDFHLAASKDKMRAGIPLTDEDRWPWLEALAAVIREHLCRGSKVVVACSALRRAYRDVLVRDGAGGDAHKLLFVLLMPPREELQRRVEARWAQGSHFMPPSLLNSQLDALTADINNSGTTLELDTPRPATGAGLKPGSHGVGMVVLRKLAAPEDIVGIVWMYIEAAGAQ